MCIRDRFYWNSGIFIWKVQAIVEAFRKYLPEHHAMFSGMMRALGTDSEKAIVEMVFSECRAISIDYGIMEKADNVYVRCGDFGWSDVGTWGSVYQHSRKDRYANAVPAEGCYLYDTRSSIVSLPAEKIAVISGLKEYIVVDTEDVLLICPRAEEQNIKKYIDEVKFNKGEEITLKDILDAVLKEDVLAIEILESVGHTLGKAIAGLINMFNPEMIVIGGLLSVAGESLMLPVRTAVNKYSLMLVYKDTQIKLSTLGERAGVIGACLLARSKALGFY